ncbi:hypothetical protein EBR66_07960 [bacterium]|nr:hypothetical protein [bacterium]
MIPLRITGQGVFLFQYISGPQPCTFMIRNEYEPNPLVVSFLKGKVRVTAGLEPLIDMNNTKGLCDISGAYYWFSIDSQNQILCAGVGEPRMETAIYLYKFPYARSAKLYLEKLRIIEFVRGTLEVQRVLKDPITGTIPLLVKTIDELTMEDIATAKYMPMSNLSDTSQKLYRCIAGKRFILDEPSFPDFSKAIQKSIVTPGGWCNTMLAKKAAEFGKPNPKETYLRITLGQNNGESPGIPYVMEIWPAGHYSPVHSHASADAVIRVLHGSIHVTLYPFLSKSVAPFGSADFKKEDVTWISPTLNQTHQLRNITGDVCVTIQCYMYEKNDRGHYDYFDYLDTDGVQQQYEPDSDMDFMNFKKTMRKEWEDKSMQGTWVNGVWRN